MPGELQPCRKGSDQQTCHIHIYFMTWVGLHDASTHTHAMNLSNACYLGWQGPNGMQR